MDETKYNSTKLIRTKQPVKTEWGAHYMVLTYFQGDTNSMVDEHFSRALSVTKNPQDPSRNYGAEDGMINEHRRPSPEWGVSPHWAKPCCATSALNLCASDEGTAAPAMGPDQPSVLPEASPATAELWPSASGGDPCVDTLSRYPTSGLHLARGGMSDQKYTSLLGLLDQEGSSRPIQESADSRAACLAGSAGLQTMNQRYPC